MTEAQIAKVAMRNNGANKKREDFRYTHNFSLNVDKSNLAQILIKFKPDYNESSDGENGTVDLELGFGSNNSRRPSFYKKLEQMSNDLIYSVWDNDTSKFLMKQKNEDIVSEYNI
jgi:hypothetical protein